MVTKRITVQWADGAGNAAASRFFVPSATSDADVSAICNDLQALSDIACLSAYKLTETAYAGSGPNALDGTHPYADNRTSLLTSLDAPSSGQTVHVAIPGPSTAVPFGNNFRIDPTNAAFTAFKAAAAAIVVSQDGAAVVDLTRGVLRVRRGPRAA